MTLAPSKAERKICDSFLSVIHRFPPDERNEVRWNEMNAKKLQELLSPETLKKHDILGSIPPLNHEADTELNGKKFLVCSYNKVGNRARSPYSNKYFPQSEKNEDSTLTYPSKILRDLEILLKEIFDSYLSLYYGKSEETLCSVYFKDVMDHPYIFAEGAILIQKQIENGDPTSGVWDSIHYITIGNQTKESICYELSTNVSLHLKRNISSSSSQQKFPTYLSTSIHRQASETIKFISLSEEETLQNHVVTIGKMIETLEIELRTQMENLYISKTREVMIQMIYDQNNTSPTAPNNLAALIAAKSKSTSCISSGTEKNNHMRQHMNALNVAMSQRRIQSKKPSSTTMTMSSNRNMQAMLMQEAMLKRKNKTDS